MSKGFWIQYWMIQGQSTKPTRETYVFYDEEDGYCEDDKRQEDLWQGEAEDWAQNAGGWSSSRYQYGFTFVKHPPIKWLQEQVNSCKKGLEFYEQQLQEATA